MDSLKARMGKRTEKLEKRLNERAEKESNDIRTILEDLAAHIRKELAEGIPEQLSLWPDPEKDAFERNRSAIKARLEKIPGEIKREVATIKKKYMNPTPRLFPVAVMFLVPQNIARM